MATLGSRPILLKNLHGHCSLCRDLRKYVENHQLEIERQLIMKPHSLFTSAAPMGIQEKCCRGDPIPIGPPFFALRPLATFKSHYSLLLTYPDHLFSVNNPYMWCPSLRFSTRTLNTTVRRLQSHTFLLVPLCRICRALQETLNPTLRR